jgi:N-acetyl sugar amidotransferase
MNNIETIKYAVRQRIDESLEVFYGLPAQVKFCRICCMSNQRPNAKNEYAHSSNTPSTTIGFGEDGVCAACRNKERQHLNVDWLEREKELMELCDKYRRNDGRYDCVVPGSGGKDSIYAAWMLKYKYGMHPLTVTWSPHLYTDVGWRNFQRWIHQGGFDNILFTPNGKVHRLLTRLATLNLLHPFQPFILGQKTIAVKYAYQYDIPLCFYGEMPGEYNGMTSKANEKSWDDIVSQGFKFDQLQSKDEIMNLNLGGTSIEEIVKKHGVALAELQPYIPMEYGKIKEKNIQVYCLGYFLKWDPQECYYFSVDKTGFQANPIRTEGTYSKYNSLDDKIDGFFYYTTFIKFGYGRATQDAAQEVRNKKITTDEAKALIKKFDGEFPVRYYQEFLDYVGMSDDEFRSLCDQFRSPHIWALVNGEWKLRHTVNGDGVDDRLMAL